MRGKSIVFPVIGTGRHNFPANEASRIMLEECVQFLQTNPNSSIVDVRFVVYANDQTLVAAFKQEMAAVLSRYGSTPQPTSPTRSALGTNLQGQVMQGDITQQNTNATVNISGPDLRLNSAGYIRRAVAAFASLFRYCSTPPPTSPTRSVLGTNVKVQVMQGDITKQNTDAIVNISGPDLDMNNAGALGKAVARASGAVVQMECRNAGRQTAGAAVVTNGGNLAVPYIIHSVPGSGNKQHLQQCVENALRLADNNGLRSVSLPAFGAGGFGLSAQDSAELTFQALVNFSPTSQTLRQVNIVIFQAPMLQAFTQEQQKRQGVSTRAKPTPLPRPQAARPKGSPGSNSKVVAMFRRTMATLRSVLVRVQGARPSGSVTSANAGGVTLELLAQNEDKGKRAVSALKKGFSDACMTNVVADKAVQKLTHKQIDKLERQALRLDVEMKLDQESGTITLRGDPKDVVEFVEEVWKELNASKEKERQREHVKLVAKNVQWYYSTGGGANVPFGKKTNAELEKARANDKGSVIVPLRGISYRIDLAEMTGVGMKDGAQITVTRNVLGSLEGLCHGACTLDYTGPF